MPEVRADDGVKIAYDVWGRRDGPPVLLIQGLGTDARGWALQRMAFGRRYRCFAPDNRGVGRTGAVPGPYSLDQMARDALAVLDAEGVDPGARRRRVDGRRHRADHRRAPPRAHPVARARVHGMPAPPMATRAAAGVGGCRA